MSSWFQGCSLKMFPSNGDSITIVVICNEDGNVMKWFREGSSKEY